LQAFFADTTAIDNAPLMPSGEIRRYREKLALWEAKTRVIRDEMNAIEEPKRAAIIKEYVDKYPEEIQAALTKPESDRSPFEALMVAKAKLYLDPESPQYLAPTKAVLAKLKGDPKKRWVELNADLGKFVELHPGKLPVGTGMTDLGLEAPKTYVLRRGIYDAPKEEVQPGFLSILDPRPARVVAPKRVESTGRRTALANVLTDPENPLTARVMVNRIWQYHFGNGLVGTPSDFGVKGDQPTHPQLLDWLASELVRNGWSLKYLHRLIMTSSVYRESSAYREAASKADPDDNLLWHFPRSRLEGEVIADSALAVSGLLDPKMGGPSVFPELPPGMSVFGGWPVTKDESERNRRSIYVFVRRNTRYPLFESFDMPDTHESCPRRNVTTSPVQALTLLNNKLTLEWAQHLAERVIQSAGGDLSKQIETAYRLALSRPPDQAEKKIVGDFFKRHGGLVAERHGAGEPLALPSNLPQKSDPVQMATLVDLCHTLINANEFVYRN